MLVVGVLVGFSALSFAQAQSFHGAPKTAKQMKNPLAGQASAVPAGKTLYEQKCASCHGKTGKGTGNIPELDADPTKSASAGEVFWFITQGSIENGMPAWASLPETQRWQIVSFVKSLSAGTGGASSKPTASTATVPAPASTSAADPKPVAAAPPSGGPFMDYRMEAPGRTHKITVSDLPAPYATKSANNGPDVVARPANGWPKAPDGFKVEQFATGLDEPRLMRRAPNGDVFLAETGAGQVRVYRGLGGDGKAQQTEIFAKGLKRPYGIAFYPPGDNPEWVYVGAENQVVRYPYHKGDLKASADAQHLFDVPTGGHETRDIQFSTDGKKMFVSVGSRSNVDDSDTTASEKNRAMILVFNPDGTGMQVYAYGIRNAGGGLLMDPKTNQLWCSVNERDGLGDNLVPDYVTHVEPGGFYGWPWWYMGGNQDPRHKGKHPELKDKVITPDVLLQAHSASLQITIYDGKQFPAEYHDDLFGANHGSWNKAMRTGYEVIRIPRGGTGKATGEYQDFLTGFVTEDGKVWGRPVGVVVVSDGSLLVSDDGSNTIWRVSYGQ